MREGLQSGVGGELATVRGLARELALWFPQHAQSMDAALALHLRRVGFNPATGEVRMLDVLPAMVIQGCGGAGCSGNASAEPSRLAETA